MIKKKKAVSPLISTVLLIMIVIIIAIIILLWSQSFIKESVVKEVGGETKNAEQFCGEVSLKTILNNVDGSFGFQNIGNIPLQGFKLKTSIGGSSKINIYNPKPVNSGFTIMVDKEPDGITPLGNYDVYEEIKIIPILMGKTKSGEVTPFECPEIYGVVI